VRRHQNDFRLDHECLGIPCVAGIREDGKEVVYVESFERGVELTLEGVVLGAL